MRNLCIEIGDTIYTSQNFIDNNISLMRNFEVNWKILKGIAHMQINLQ